MKKLSLTLFCCMAVLFLFNGCAYKLDTFGKDYSSLEVRHSRPIYLEKVRMKCLGDGVLSDELRQKLIQKYPKVYTGTPSGVPAAVLYVEAKPDDSDSVFCQKILCLVRLNVGDLKSERNFKITPVWDAFQQKNLQDDKLMAIYADCGADFTDSVLKKAYLCHPKMFPIIKEPASFQNNSQN